MSARVYLLVLSELVTSGALGCTTLPGVSSGETGEAAAASARAEANPKRQPHASTFVAYGKLYDQAASEPGRSAPEQEDLRTKARLAYQQALQIHPNDLAALTALAQLYRNQDDYERAVAAYDRAIQIYPREAALRYELGMCHARRKNWDPALLNLQKAVQADPDNRRYAHAYGLCLARAQRYNEGFAVLAKVEGLANAHYDLARMLHHLQQDTACKEHLRLALAQNPDIVPAKQLLTSLEATAQETANSSMSTGAAKPAGNLGRPIVDKANESLLPGHFDCVNGSAQPAAQVAEDAPPMPAKADNR